MATSAYGISPTQQANIEAQAGTKPAGGMNAIPPAAAPAVDPYSPQAINYYQQLDQNKYIDAFNQNLAQQRSAINTSLQQALGELGQRRDAAAQVVAGLPGQIASSFDMANGNYATNAMAGAHGLSSDVRGGAGALAAPFQNALAVNRNAGNALAPFLKLGMLANYQSGEAQLNNSALQANAGLSQDAANFQLQSMHDKQVREQGLADRQAEWAHADAQAQQQHDWSVQDRAAQNEAATAAQPSSQPIYQKDGFTNGEVDQIHSSPQYQRFAALIKGGQNVNAPMIANELKHSNPRLLQLLVADYPEMNWGGNVPAAGNPNAGWARLDLSPSYDPGFRHLFTNPR